VGLPRKICLFLKKSIYFEIQVCFFMSDELENNCRVVEKCAYAPKTLMGILVVVIHIVRFQELPERGQPGAYMNCVQLRAEIPNKQCYIQIFTIKNVLRKSIWWEKRMLKW